MNKEGIKFAKSKLKEAEKKKDLGIVLVMLIIFILALNIFFLKNVSAEDNYNIGGSFLGVFPQGSVVNLTNYCQDGGCSGITLISIKYPDGTTKIINQAMTMSGQIGYYQFSDTANIGTYYFTTTGSNGITNEDSFKIGGGNLGFFILMFVVCYGLTFVGIFFKNEWVSLFGCFGLLILGIYTSFNGIDLFKNTMTNAISYITIAIGLGVGFAALIEISNY